MSSRFYDQYILSNSNPSMDYLENGNYAVDDDDGDPWEKSFLCGSFAGFVQCVVICPMEHIKVRM